jgi:hypothetical protein
MLKLKFFGLVLGTTAAVSAISSPALADTFVLNGNKALNTNARFRLIDGHPRASIWDHNINDADQHFDRRAGRRGGELLVHRSTGKCLNAYRRWNGAEINVYPCNPDDPDQNFNVESVGNGEVQIRLSEIRNNVRFCVDSPTRNNGGIVTLWECLGNANQRFRINGAGTVNPPVNPPTNPGGSYYGNFESFVNFARGQRGISRLDRGDLRGQCVTLIARYIQEVYLTGSQRTQQIAFGNGRDTANVVALRFSQFFSPVTNQGLPRRGAVISFPQLAGIYGHTAIVMESRTLNGQRQVRILDSNGDSRNENSTVREYSYWINIPNGTAQGYGSNIYWTNPR